jgi:type VI secretion system protein ImpJ
MILKIARPLWAEGIFMTPQHFQQQCQWERFCDLRIANMACGYPWGVRRVAFDLEALSIDRLQLATLDACLPDGTFVDTDVADVLPPVRDLSAVPSNRDAITVLIGLPIASQSGSNCLEPDAVASRPLRYLREYREVIDRFGEGEEEISVERHALALLFDFEVDGGSGAGYISLPIGRFQRNPQGHFEPDPIYVPPCLFISASDRLTHRVKRLCDILSAKSASLAVRRRERADHIADYAVADVSLFWLLHTVNSHFADLAAMCHIPNQTPERLHLVLAKLAGALMTFSTTDSLRAIRPYDHLSPETGFAELELLIRNLLDTVLPSHVVPIDLERLKHTTWIGYIKDERLVEGADYYLSVQSELPAQKLLEQLPKFCKAGAPDEVQQIVNSALPGIPLQHMTRVPASIPFRIENHYFALDRGHAAFTRMIAARACQFYIPASISEASIELYAVLSS